MRSPLDEWQEEIRRKLRNPKAIDFKKVRHFTLNNDLLYFRTPGGLLARCLNQVEATEKLREIHAQSCGIEGPILVRLV